MQCCAKEKPAITLDWCCYNEPVDSWTTVVQVLDRTIEAPSSQATSVDCDVCRAQSYVESSSPSV